MENFLPVEEIPDADIYLRKLIEDIDLGEDDVGEAVDIGCIFQKDKVEPSDTPRTSGRGTVLVAAIADEDAEFVVKFGREYALADARDIGFHYTVDAVNPVRRQPGTDTCSARHRMGACKEWIRETVVDIKKSSLRAFEQNTLAVSQSVDNCPFRVADVRLQLLADFEVLICDCLGIERIGMVKILDQGIFFLARVSDSFAEPCRVAKVAHHETGTGHLVGEGRTDSAFGCPDYSPRVLSGAAFLLEFVEEHMVGHYQAGVKTDNQIFTVEAPRDKLLDFIHKSDGINRHTACDDAYFFGMENTARKVIELENLVPYRDRVPCVITALASDDDIRITGEEVDNFSLAFISPLCSYNDVGGHRSRTSPKLSLNRRTEGAWYFQNAGSSREKIILTD